MTRRAQPLDAALGPLAAFARDLRELRASKGRDALSIDQISSAEQIPRSTLYTALKGDRLPSAEVVAALARAWGGDEAVWVAKRSALQDTIAASGSRRPAQALRDGSVFRTVPTTHTVLIVVRTASTLLRMLDVVSLVSSDIRVQVLFTIEPGSPFVDDLSEVLRDRGVAAIPWHQACHRRFDLVLTARLTRELPHGPVVLIPHWTYARVDLPAVLGVSEIDDMRNVVTVVEETERERLRADVRALAENAVIGGDSSFDRMVTSHTERGRYRRALGVDDDQRLVVLSSSWSLSSLFGEYPDLPIALLSQLPSDDFRVALVLHPNVWGGHGHWQIKTWLHDALERGLLLIPSGDERATLLAADCVIGDHGQLTRYATALGHTVLSLGSRANPGETADGSEAIVPSAGPPLDVDGDLHAQVTWAIERGDRDQALSVVTTLVERATAHTRVLRERLYAMLGIAEPDAPPELTPLPDPSPIVRNDEKFVVSVIGPPETTEDLDEPGVLVDRRAPFSQLGDWLLLAPISPQAKVLYWALQAHVTATGGAGERWPTQDALADMMGLSDGRKVRPYLRELEAIDAISVRTANGVQQRSLYTVHQAPPAGYANLTSLSAFYAQRRARIEAARRQQSAGG